MRPIASLSRSRCVGMLVAALISLSCSSEDVGSNQDAAWDANGGDVFDAAGDEVMDGADSRQEAMCGFGDTATVCGQVQFCDDPDNCGRGRSCVARPESCDSSEFAVCGCDGQIYPSECAAHLAGVDICRDVTTTPCGPLEGAVPCGGVYCPAGRYYCYASSSDRISCDSRQRFSCEPLPAECAPGDGGPRDCCSEQGRCPVIITCSWAEVATDQLGMTFECIGW